MLLVSGPQAARVLPGGCTKGELTLLGQRQAIDTGAWLRERYVDQLSFLPPTATAGAVSGRHVGIAACSLLSYWRMHSAACLCMQKSWWSLHAGRTTNYRRTVATLGYLVAGLYESADAAIHVVTATELDEILFGNAKACEQLARLMTSQRRALKGGWLCDGAVAGSQPCPTRPALLLHVLQRHFVCLTVHLDNACEHGVYA